MTDTSPGPWLVVQTQPHREMLAVEHLRRQKFRTYCPLVRKRIRHANRSRDAVRPLFPGYVFVALDDDGQRWRPIRSTVGVRSLVLAGDAPARLDGAIIAALKEREIDGAVSVPTRPLEAGQRVAIQGGPMDGVVGTILEARENQRHLILLSLLTSSVKAQIDQANLRLVG